MLLPPTEPHPELDELLRKEKAKDHRLTPGEIWDQRVSWVYANLPHNSATTREEVEARATEIYGPRPCG